VIALSEGAVPETGLGEVDAFGHRMKGGAADHLAQVIGDRLKLKVRMDKPNYLQRSFSTCISHTDADEAYRLGREAVRRGIEGQSNIMVTLERRPGTPYFCDVGTTLLSEVANAEKLLPAEYIAEGEADVTEAFLGYARPLIGESLSVLGRLAGHPVSPR
jgi:6-phosphofructokinase 1